MILAMNTVAYFTRIYGNVMPENFDWGKMAAKYREEFKPEDLLKLAKEIRSMGCENLEIWEPNFSFRVYTVQDAVDMAAKLRQMGFKELAYCSGGLRSDEIPEVEKCYKFVSAMGVKVITGCMPINDNKALIEEIERSGKLYNVYYAVENHPAPNMDDPSEIRRITEGYSHIGANLDIGNYYNYSPYDVMEATTTLKDKIFHVHFKDGIKGVGHSLPLGEGEIPMEEIINLLKQWKFKGMASIEYEHANDPAPGLKTSLDYLKARV